MERIEGMFDNMEGCCWRRWCWGEEEEEEEEEAAVEE
jgi:hypothetical protein